MVYQVYSLGSYLLISCQIPLEHWIAIDVIIFSYFCLPAFSIFHSSIHQMRISLGGSFFY